MNKKLEWTELELVELDIEETLSGTISLNSEGERVFTGDPGNQTFQGFTRS